MSKSSCSDEECDSWVGLSEFCETFKWVGLDMDKDCNFTLVCKFGSVRWRGLGVRNPKLGGLRTTFVVVVAIIEEVLDGREVEDAGLGDL